MQDSLIFGNFEAGEATGGKAVGLGRQSLRIRASAPKPTIAPDLASS